MDHEKEMNMFTLWFIGLLLISVFHLHFTVMFPLTVCAIIDLLLFLHLFNPKRGEGKENTCPVCGQDHSEEHPEPGEFLMMDTDGLSQEEWEIARDKLNSIKEK